MLYQITDELSDLPHYHNLEVEDPPEYSASVHHLSIVYYTDETEQMRAIHMGRSFKAASFTPLLLEINSTQVNLFHIKGNYNRYIAYNFNELNPSFVDPNLNIKSKSSSKLNFIGQGIGSSKNLFSIADLNLTSTSLSFSSVSNRQNNTPNSSFLDLSTNSDCRIIQPRHALISNNSNSSLSTMFSQSNTSTMSNSTFSPTTPSLSRESSSSFSKLFDKLSFRKYTSSDKETDNDFFSPSKGKQFLPDHSNINLSDSDKFSQDMLYIQKLLNNKPDINQILDTDYTAQDAQLLNLKSKLFKSFSLQELVKFGNAADLPSKPFALRMILPSEQFVLVSYNANVYSSIFYKLNIAKELSLDLDLRVPLPLDYCVPRRSRRRGTRQRSNTNNTRTSNRNRSDSDSTSRIRSTSTTSINSNIQPKSLTTGTVTTRSRSGSLLNNNDDGDDDEFDTTFNIDDNSVSFQPQPSIQPQVIFEDEILNDIIQLEPAEQTISSVSNISRSTSYSVFSSVERYSSQITDATILSNSLSPITSQDENDNFITTELNLSDKTPIFFEDESHFKYKELVFAVKCIKSCKNKTIPWCN